MGLGPCASGEPDLSSLADAWNFLPAAPWPPQVGAPLIVQSAVPIRIQPSDRPIRVPLNVASEFVGYRLVSKQRCKGFAVNPRDDLPDELPGKESILLELKHEMAKICTPSRLHHPGDEQLPAQRKLAAEIVR